MPLTSPCPYQWDRTLQTGSSGEDVLKLQEFLNSNPTTAIALSGPGSAGHESGIFGTLTKKSVISFQEEYSSDILSPAGLAKGSGTVGTLTRAKLNALCAAPVVSASNATASATSSLDALTVSNPGQPASSLAPAGAGGVPFISVTLTAGNNGKPRKKRGDKDFQFLGFAVCGECGYAITAERKIKRSGRVYKYYRCTHKSRTYVCRQNRFMREEEFAKQVRELCQNVSLPDEWREKYILKLDESTGEARHTSDAFVQNLRSGISDIKGRIDRLNDAYLAGSFELAEFQAEKNRLMSERKTLTEKLSDFELKGNRRLELFRNWIIEVNQAKNSVERQDIPAMRDFVAAIGSNRRLASKTLSVDFQKPFSYLAETQERTRSVRDKNLVNSDWWTPPIIV